MPELRPDSIRFGRFEVFGRLGYGGMGEVFRARDTDGQPVALKLLRPEYAGQGHFRDMFMGEAKVSSLLHHANVVRLIDVGEVDGMLYLATELIEGVSLDKILDSGPLPVGVAVHLLVKLLDALHYAHELTSDVGAPLGIVHRDVSASNAMVSIEGELKLTDFGLAKIDGLSLTLTNEVKGKRAYMAPEQHEGGAMDRRVDLFATGVLLHEMVVGKRPFPDVLEWMKGTRRIVGTPFDDIVTKALTIDPKGRYMSAAVLSAALVAAHAPDPDATTYLRERVLKTRESLRPLNKFDRLLIHELASAPRETRAAPEARKSAGQIETSPHTKRAFHSDAVTIERDSGREQLMPAAPTVITPLVESMPGAEAVVTGTFGRETTGNMRPQRTTIFGLGVALALGLSVGLIGYLYARSTTQPKVASVDPAPRVTPPSLPTAIPTPPVANVEPAHPLRPVHAAQLAPHPPPRSGVSHVRPAPMGGNGAPGFLVLDTTPWSTVYLGARRLGTTPLRVPLPPGRHVLSLAPKDSRERRQIPVTISSGREQRVSLPLQ